MRETYLSLAAFAQTGGLILFIIAFIGVLIYAFRPSSRKTFEDAAQIPLKED